MECIDLFARCGGIFRVVYESPASPRAKDPWLARVLCKHGHFYAHGGDEIGFATDTHGSIATRLAALPFVTVVQDGDDGINIVFHVDHFDEIAKIVRPCRRRRLSEDQRDAARKRLEKYRQDHPDWRPGQRMDSEKPMGESENPTQGPEQTGTDESDVDEAA